MAASIYAGVMLHAAYQRLENQQFARIAVLERSQSDAVARLRAVERQSVNDLARGLERAAEQRSLLREDIDLNRDALFAALGYIDRLEDTVQKHWLESEEGKQRMAEVREIMRRGANR